MQLSRSDEDDGLKELTDNGRELDSERDRSVYADLKHREHQRRRCSRNAVESSRAY